MANDARTNTYTYLDGYVTAGNILEDDDATPATLLICFSGATYPMSLVFFGTKNVDVVYSIGKPTTEPLQGHDMYIYGYKEIVPITISVVDKTGVTGEQLIWRAEAELRRVVETYPLGSTRELERVTDNTQLFGMTKLYSVTYLLKYKRSKTA